MSKGRILIVEDAAEVADDLSRKLGRLDYEGARVFISRHGIVGLCEHGKELGGEVIRER